MIAAATSVELWVEAAKQAPALVTLAISMLWWINYIKVRDEQDRKKDEAHRITLREIGESCHEFQEKLTEQNQAVLTANTDALHENTRMLGRIAEVIAHQQRNGE